MNDFEFEIKMEEISNMKTYKARKACFEEIHKILTRDGWSNCSLLRNKDLSFREATNAYICFRKVCNDYRPCASGLPQYINDSLTDLPKGIYELAISENVPKKEMERLNDVLPPRFSTPTYQSLSNCMDILLRSWAYPDEIKHIVNLLRDSLEPSSTL